MMYNTPISFRSLPKVNIYIYVIVISPLRVLYPDLQTQLTRVRSARVGVSVNGYCTIRGDITDL